MHALIPGIKAIGKPCAESAMQLRVQRIKNISEMMKISDIKRKIEIWLFRFRRKRLIKRDKAIMANSIKKANELSKQAKCRLWVVKVDTADYRIMTQGEVKAVLRRIGLSTVLDIYKKNDSIVHITGKR